MDRGVAQARCVGACAEISYEMTGMCPNMKTRRDVADSRTHFTSYSSNFEQTMCFKWPEQNRPIHEFLEQRWLRGTRDLKAPIWTEPCRRGSRTLTGSKGGSCVDEFNVYFSYSQQKSFSEQKNLADSSFCLLSRISKTGCRMLKASFDGIFLPICS